MFEEENGQEKLRNALGIPSKKILYDSSVIQQAAQTLYAAATNVIFWHALKGASAGLIVGWIASRFIADDAESFFAFGAIASFLTLMGVSAGYEKAQEFKLKAQTALCQAQIEENTRELIQKLKPENESISKQDPEIHDSLSTLRAYK